MCSPTCGVYAQVAGQGNFGSLDDDPPAAMRYTECRLAAAAEDMLLDDLEADTVDFATTFDASQVTECRALCALWFCYPQVFKKRGEKGGGGEMETGREKVLVCGLPLSPSLALLPLPPSLSQPPCPSLLSPQPPSLHLSSVRLTDTAIGALSVSNIDWQPATCTQ